MCPPGGSQEGSASHFDWHEAGMSYHYFYCCYLVNNKKKRGRGHCHREGIGAEQPAVSRGEMGTFLWDVINVFELVSKATFTLTFVIGAVSGYLTHSFSPYQ